MPTSKSKETVKPQEPEQTKREFLLNSGATIYCICSAIDNIDFDDLLDTIEDMSAGEYLTFKQSVNDVIGMLKALKANLKLIERNY